MISYLIEFHRFHLTEAHQLVTKTMSFIKQPKTFSINIRRTYQFILKNRYISEELFIVEHFFIQLFTVYFRSKNGGIYQTVCQSGKTNRGFHLIYSQIQFRILFFELLEKQRKQIGCNSRQNTDSKDSFHGLFLFTDNTFNQRSLIYHLFCLFYHFSSC